MSASFDMLIRPATEIVQTPRGHYRREWFTFAEMRAQFPDWLYNSGVRFAYWKRDSDGYVWYALYS